MQNSAYDHWVKRAGESAAHRLFQSEVGPRALREQHGPWKIISVLNGSHEAIAQRELAGGAQGFALTTADSILALQNLPLHEFTMRNEAGNAGALALVKMIGILPLNPAQLDISFGLQSPETVKDLMAAGFTGPFLEVAEAGAGLGAVLTDACVQLRQLHFLDDAHLSAAIAVKLFADQNIFVTLAKFRATRILWARLLAECKLPQTPLKLHGETATALASGVDHEHFMLRAVSACMGAGLGGTDTFVVRPYNLTEKFEQRMARNIQIILLQEAHLSRVADAAAGAGYVEHLTRQFCAEAWDYLKKQDTLP